MAQVTDPYKSSPAPKKPTPPAKKAAPAPKKTAPAPAAPAPKPKTAPAAPAPQPAAPAAPAPVRAAAPAPTAARPAVSAPAPAAPLNYNQRIARMVAAQHAAPVAGPPAPAATWKNPLMGYNQWAARQAEQYGTQREPWEEEPETQVNPWANLGAQTFEPALRALAPAAADMLFPGAQQSIAQPTLSTLPTLAEQANAPRELHPLAQFVPQPQPTFSAPQLHAAEAALNLAPPTLPQPPAPAASVPVLSQTPVAQAVQRVIAALPGLLSNLRLPPAPIAPQTALLAAAAPVAARALNTPAVQAQPLIPATINAILQGVPAPLAAQTALLAAGAPPVANAARVPAPIAPQTALLTAAAPMAANFANSIRPAAPAPTTTGPAARPPAAFGPPMTPNPYSQPASWFAPTGATANMSVGSPASIAPTPQAPVPAPVPPARSPFARPGSVNGAEYYPYARGYAQNTNAGFLTDAMLNAQAAQAKNAAGGTGRSTYSGDAPSGVNQVWWEEFKRDHNGEDPISFYGGGEDALDRAWADKLWGDQFYRTYNAAPDQYDWQASYYDRKYGNGPYSNNYGGYGGGGGGYGGGYDGGYDYAPAAPAVNPAMPYYKYDDFARTWYNRTGNYPTETQGTRFAEAFKLYAKNRLGIDPAQATTDQFNAFMDVYLDNPKGVDNLAFIGVGNI